MRSSCCLASRYARTGDAVLSTCGQQKGRPRTAATEVFTSAIAAPGGWRFSAAVDPERQALVHRSIKHSNNERTGGPDAGLFAVRRAKLPDRLLGMAWFQLDP
jgi:hypothetical protein